MDREQATAIIQNRLKLGHDKQDIASDLSKVLDLPTELISRFVDKVAGTLSFTSNEHISKLSIIESEQKILDTLQVEIDPDKYTNLGSTSDGSPSAEGYPDYSPQHPETLPVDQKSDPKNEITKEELTSLVLKSLKKKHSFNDIVEAVCKHSGMQWNQAQPNQTSYCSFKKQQNWCGCLQCPVYSWRGVIDALGIYGFNRLLFCVYRSS